MEESFIKSVRAAVEYTKVHFSTEEELMRKINYPDFQTHKLQHEDFARRILEDVKSFESGDRKIGMKFVQFLRDWLLEHIAVVDKAFALYAKKQKSNFT
jgi:hemerythrin